MIAASRDSYTGRFLAPLLNGTPAVKRLRRRA